MKICILPCSNKGGIDTYTRELAKALYENTTYEIYTIGDVQVSSRKGKIPQIKSANLNEVFSKMNFDLIHSASPNFVAFTRVASHLVVTAWFYPYSLLGGLSVIRKSLAWWKWPAASILRLRTSLHDRRGYQKADKIICVTKALKEDLSKRGYDAVYLPPGMEQRKVRKEKYPEFTLAFVAYALAHERKGLKYLLKALQKVKLDVDGYKFRLLLIGNPSKKLHKLVNSHKLKDETEILGKLSREQTLNVLSRSHLLVAPSLYEEFGFTVLEAMSVGVPVIASDIHSFQDLVTKETGYLVNVKNEEEFAEKLTRLIGDDKLRKEMGRNSLKRFKENFSWDKLLPKILMIYDKIIEKGM